jgi:hypothetical protein
MQPPRKPSAQRSRRTPPPPGASRASLAQAPGASTITQLLLAWGAGDGATYDPRKARLVELRYLAGLSIPKAAALGTSPATLGREWTVTRLWLRRELDR